MASNNNMEVSIDAMECEPNEEGQCIKYRYYKYEDMTKEESIKVLKDHLERVKNGSCEGKPNVRRKLVLMSPFIYCDDWEDIKPYDEFVKDAKKEQNAIKIQRWIKHKSIWEWRDDYSGNCDNVKTNNKEVNDLMEELDDTLGGGSCWNIKFGALTRYIVKLENDNKELKKWKEEAKSKGRRLLEQRKELIVAIEKMYLLSYKGELDHSTVKYYMKIAGVMLIEDDE